VAPTATLGTSGPAIAGSPVAVAFTNPSDPSSIDTSAGFHYSFALTQDALATSYASAGTSSSTNITFNTSATYTVYGRIFDKDNGYTDYYISIRIGTPPSATFQATTLVNEGSTDTVTFTNQAGGTGGYTYSYDFNNDNTFEITGSSSASATVPESYLDDGPSTLVVLGRITDSAGNHADYTTSITVNNVAPTANLSNNGPVTTGSPVTVSFTNATDPSTADTNAGFHYSFAQSQGGLAATYAAAGTSSSTSYTYSTTGTDTVYGRIFDKDNGYTDYTTSITVNAVPPTEPTTLLAPSDFTYVGSYSVTAASQATYGMGLTSRYVNGQLRFMTIAYAGSVNADLVEFALPNQLGQPITTLTNRWDNIWSKAPNVGGGDEYGLWWEDLGNGTGRLWTTQSTDYPNDVGIFNTQAITVRTLNADGTISNLSGEYGFAGVGQRAIYGGVQPIPQSFRDQYGITQPYAVGWGGYTSRMEQGLVPSMGLMMLAIPDVTSYASGSVIPTTDFKILADHRSGTTSTDWYATGTPSAFDRGQRTADVVNYFDGGDPRQNPSTAPSLPPAPGAQWLSPAPDGSGRFVWGDSFYNTGIWINGPNKSGFIAIGSFAKGKAYYANSTLNNSGRDAELQIFNPADFGKVLQGQMNPWNVQPAATKLLTNDLTPLGLLYPSSGDSPGGAVAGATFDPTTNLLYLWCPSVNGGYGCDLVVYKVND
jgi:hypothetical protein